MNENLLSKLVTGLHLKCLKLYNLNFCCADWAAATAQKTSELFFSTPTFQVEQLNKHLFITAKPMIYLVNLSEKDFIRKKNKW